MLYPAIRDFLQERKEKWLKDRIKKAKTMEAEHVLQQEATERFSLAYWLPDAAKRAKQLKLSSHPVKFTHPDIKASTILTKGERRNNGFLRTGNIICKTHDDVFGNAAALDVYKFLMLILHDGKTILQHLLDNSELIQQQFDLPTASFMEISTGLLAIKNEQVDKEKTHGLIKQVYFPIDEAKEDYHLLSILTPSKNLYELKNRIQQLHYSEETKVARAARKKAEVCDHGYAEIYNLTAIGFGGTKPQNISVLNNQNGGIAYLLASVPPVLDKRRTQPPKYDFFKDSLWLNGYKELFEHLHKALKNEYINRHTKRNANYWRKQIIFQIIDDSWKVRYLEAGWSLSDNYQRLPKIQKLWLDQKYREQRENDTENVEWLVDIKASIARWIINTYEEFYKDEKGNYVDSEFRTLTKLMDDYEASLR